MNPLANLTEQRDSLANEITILSRKKSALEQTIRELVENKDSLTLSIVEKNKEIEVLETSTVASIKRLFTKIKE